ncbi:MAG: hypothetical protein WBI07_07080 [Mobilitalea sp.]
MAKRNYLWSEKYEVINENIGEGGNATVQLVQEKNTEKKYALKVLRQGGKKKKLDLKMR